MIGAFLVCQSFVVAFIALHDWIPLGSLNNVSGVRSVDSRSRLVLVTVLSTLPFAAGLAGSAWYASARFPMWLVWLLWITYGTAIYGMLRAWYVPYLLVEEPDRIARYQTMFAGTHTFLPRRNGIAPNTIHAIFHLILMATAVLLVVLTYHRLFG